MSAQNSTIVQIARKTHNSLQYSITEHGNQRSKRTLQHMTNIVHKFETNQQLDMTNIAQSKENSTKQSLLSQNKSSQKELLILI